MANRESVLRLRRRAKLEREVGVFCTGGGVTVDVARYDTTETDENVLFCLVVLQSFLKFTSTRPPALPLVTAFFAAFKRTSPSCQVTLTSWKWADTVLGHVAARALSRSRHALTRRGPLDGFWREVYRTYRICREEYQLIYPAFRRVRHSLSSAAGEFD